jgi:hypothetical protein
MIPNKEVEILSFGTISTILTEYGPNFLLRFGPTQEVSKTLEMLGCTRETISLFERGHQHQSSSESSCIYRFMFLALC